MIRYIQEHLKTTIKSERRHPMNRPAVKAGLIGGAAAVVATLLGLIPVLGCLSLPLAWLIYLAAGILAAAWLLPPRQAGAGAGQGALAGVIAGLINGLAGMALAPLSLSLAGGPEQIIRQIPPESLQQLAQAGMDPRMLVSSGAMVAYSSICCGLGLIVAVALGALGGLIYAAAKPQ
jgi:hypothetical protein